MDWDELDGVEVDDDWLLLFDEVDPELLFWEDVDPELFPCDDGLDPGLLLLFWEDVDPGTVGGSLPLELFDCWGDWEEGCDWGVWDDPDPPAAPPDPGADGADGPWVGLGVAGLVPLLPPLFSFCFSSSFFFCCSWAFNWAVFSFSRTRFCSAGVEFFNLFWRFSLPVAPVNPNPPPLSPSLVVLFALAAFICDLLDDGLAGVLATPLAGPWLNPRPPVFLEAKVSTDSTKLTSPRLDIMNLMFKIQLI